VQGKIKPEAMGGLGLSMRNNPPEVEPRDGARLFFLEHPALEDVTPHKSIGQKKNLIKKPILPNTQVERQKSKRNV
jgi:hypothetical protein